MEKRNPGDMAEASDLSGVFASKNTSNYTFSNISNRNRLRVVAARMSSARWRPYLRWANGDIEAAFELYQWNMKLASSAVHFVGMAEVFVRNAFDLALQEWALKRGYESWMQPLPLDTRGRSVLDEAMLRSRFHLGISSRGKVISELPFGFWRFLASSRYLTTIWIPSAVRAFPEIREDSRNARVQVEGHLQQLHKLRNRAAHHEPVHHRDLESDFESGVRLVSWISVDAALWMRNQSDLVQVLGERPILG